MLFNQEYFDFAGTSVTLPRQIIKSTIKDILIYAKKYLDKPVKELDVLDIGSGFGDYSLELAKHVRTVVGIEPYKKAFIFSNTRIKKIKNVKFKNCMIEDYKTNPKFDLAISLTTLEHMPNAYLSYKNVFKLLKPGGVLYLTAPNKLWPFESHYKLPFLAWFPLPIANTYLRLFRNKTDYKDCSYSKTYFGIKKLFNKMPCTYTFIVPKPDAPYLGCGKKHNTMFLSVSIFLLNHFPFLWVISKGFILLAVKNVQKFIH